MFLKHTNIEILSPVFPPSSQVGGIDLYMTTAFKFYAPFDHRVWDRCAINLDKRTRQDYIFMYDLSLNQVQFKLHKFRQKGFSSKAHFQKILHGRLFMFFVFTIERYLPSMIFSQITVIYLDKIFPCRASTRLRKSIYSILHTNAMYCTWD